MRFEDQRGLHEDLERLEDAIAFRYAEEPKNVSLCFLDPAHLSNADRP